MIKSNIPIDLETSSLPLFILLIVIDEKTIEMIAIIGPIIKNTIESKLKKNTKKNIIKLIKVKQILVTKNFISDFIKFKVKENY